MGIANGYSLFYTYTSCKAPLAMIVHTFEVMLIVCIELFSEELVFRES